MKKLFTIAVLAISLFFLTSCTEEQKVQVDQAADQVKPTTEIGQAILDSPAGQLIPEPIRYAIEIAGFVLISGALAWQSWRKQNTARALEELVRGMPASLATTKEIDRVKRKIPVAISSSVKIDSS